MAFSSNIDDPHADFRAALDAFGLHSPSRKGRTVGDRALGTIADGILERSARKEDPGGGRWANNAPSTIARKGRDDANVDTGAMLSDEQVRGETSVAHDEAAMTYGTDDECRAKAGWAHAGASRSRIQRPFYLITDSDADGVIDGLADDILEHFAHG